MKRLTKVVYVFWLLIIILGCKGATMDFQNPDVNLFVKQLKAGTYETKSPEGFIQVPNFTVEDIPNLLSYSTDLTIIPSFPLPPMAPNVTGDIKLGECMLWIIEAIRLGTYPSLGCHMVRVDAENYEARYFLTDEEIIDASNHYKYWWDNRSYPKTRWMIDPCYDDPLCGTGYQWW